MEASATTAPGQALAQAHPPFPHFGRASDGDDRYRHITRRRDAPRRRVGTRPQRRAASSSFTSDQADMEPIVGRPAAQAISGSGRDAPRDQRTNDRLDVIGRLEVHENAALVDPLHQALQI